MELAFNNGVEEIVIELLYKKRRTIEIRVVSPGKIRVISPIGVPEKRIIEILNKRQKWIFDKLAMYRNSKQVNLDVLLDGQILYFLGESCYLKILEHKDIIKPMIYKEKNVIYIKTFTNDTSILVGVLKGWYKERALEIITERINHYKDSFVEYPASIKIKDQKTIWGSCTSKNTLSFNLRCIMLTIEQLDYIVVHEMCHMLEKNHSKKFWALVEDILPNYKNIRRGLKEIRF